MTGCNLRVCADVSGLAVAACWLARAKSIHAWTRRLVGCSELGVSGPLPTGTVTLLVAGVEGCTRLWEIPPEEMTAASARPPKEGSPAPDIAAAGSAMASSTGAAAARQRW